MSSEGGGSSLDFSGNALGGFISRYVERQAGGTALGELERNRRANTYSLISGLSAEDQALAASTVGTFLPSVGSGLKTSIAEKTKHDAKTAAEKLKVETDAAAEQERVLVRTRGERETERDLAIRRTRRLAGLAGGFSSTNKTSGSSLSTLGGSFSGRSLLGA